MYDAWTKSIFHKSTASHLHFFFPVEFYRGGTSIPSSRSLEVEKGWKYPKTGGRRGREKRAKCRKTDEHQPLCLAILCGGHSIAISDEDKSDAPLNFSLLQNEALEIISLVPQRIEICSMHVPKKTHLIRFHFILHRFLLPKNAW